MRSLAVVGMSLLTGLLIGCQGAGTSPPPLDQVNSRNTDVVVMRKGQVPFPLSVNDDDDDQNGTVDLKQSPPTAAEDNLRELHFFAAGDDCAQVIAPLIFPTAKSALGVKVRAWDGTKAAPFTFGAILPATQAAPLVIFFEGIGESKVDEVRFEYQYYKKDPQGTKLCQGNPVSGDGGGGGLATVATVSFSGGTRNRGLTAHQKLLATGNLSVTATCRPKLPGATYLWSYDAPASGTFAAGTQTTLQSQFTATTVFTPIAGLNQSKVHFTITDPRQPTAPIEIRESLNITAPRTVTADPAALAAQPSQPNPISTAGIINAAGAAATKFRLFNWNNARTGYAVDYTVRDQFGVIIKDSEYGGAKVQVREETPFASPIAPLLAWFHGSRTTVQWKEILGNGHFHDKLVSDRGQGIPMDQIMDLTPGNFHLLTNAVGQVTMSMNPHVWHATVDRDQTALDKMLTHNSLQVTQTGYTPHTTATGRIVSEEATFSATYTFTLDPP